MMTIKVRILPALLVLSTGWSAVADELSLAYGFNYSAEPRHAPPLDPARARSFAPGMALPGTLLYTWQQKKNPLLLDRRLVGISLRVDSDTYRGKRFQNAPWTFGAPDTVLAAKVFTTETERFPKLSLEYRIKLPTASVSDFLGSGQYDHRVLFGIDKSFSQSLWSVGGNAGYLNIGRKGQPARQRGFYLAGVTHNFAAPASPSQTLVSFTSQIAFLPAVLGTTSDAYSVSTLSFPIAGNLSFSGVATIAITPYLSAAGVTAQLKYTWKRANP